MAHAGHDDGHGGFLKCMRPRERFALPQEKRKTHARVLRHSMSCSPTKAGRRRFFSTEKAQPRAASKYRKSPTLHTTCNCNGSNHFRCRFLESLSSPGREPLSFDEQIELTTMTSMKKKKWEEKFISKEWELSWFQKWRRRVEEDAVAHDTERSRASFHGPLKPKHEASSSSSGFRRRSLSDAGNMGFMGFSLGQWQVESMLRAGIPIEYRGQVWFLCSGAEQKRSSAPPDAQYDALLWRVDEVPDDVGNEIEKDLYRTFPQEPDSREEREGNVSELRRVLSMYSLRNPSVGYCQSMNFLVAVLLVYMGEEEAFWVLACVIEDLVPEYHTTSMVGSRVDQHVFHALVAQKLPDVASHLSTLHVHLAPLTFKWFLCLFVNSLPLETTLRVWDVFFAEGAKVIHRIGLTLLKLHADAILACDEAFDVYETLKFSTESLRRATAPYRTSHWGRTDDYCVCDTLLRLAFDKAFLGPFPYGQIVELRVHFASIVDAELLSRHGGDDDDDVSEAKPDEYDFVEDFEIKDYDFLSCSASGNYW
ncbi:hypothetical protein SPRG_04025 [Saprolegnia parasitica CBS 223.65]|uniref:Rab-GAP TBC domain-containing protein n=1 Tax=Saprolegnia parasitica (strain CBS 223.65) TaxID=695850 RepID=A0A067CL18_SAPPC|nr:hypothetical protein SPRG_04025 [Saprolegnia parasitica CBS 223.65]KDO31409.1 hypothetical protein SPRG_04025 [Saprolegnia parasitica CBS 223.65]|eukprot:XP_012198005.1 hypothetical protein SPRG_04025 [Saprolegnia parasitica CBS 223.65]